MCMYMYEYSPFSGGSCGVVLLDDVPQSEHIQVFYGEWKGERKRERGGEGGWERRRGRREEEEEEEEETGEEECESNPIILF